ncbi:putative Asp-hemolysin precursor [Xylogone sp. PMI_703]|nr:putative Asp-hemolysin precursor [Xylogone sp. PMI_703]
MGYAEDVVIKIQNETGVTIKLADTQLLWYGKFHKPSHKDVQINEREELDGVRIENRESFSIYSCGRADSATGTEGTIDLTHNNGDKFATLYWECSWGKTTNNFEIRDNQGDYAINATGWNRTGQSLGTVDVKVMRK